MEMSGILAMFIASITGILQTTAGICWDKGSLPRLRPLNCVGYEQLRLPHEQ
jgi:hypothetical protein